MNHDSENNREIIYKIKNKGRQSDTHVTFDKISDENF